MDRAKKTNECKECGSSPTVGHGLCMKHYMRLRRFGTTARANMENKGKKCLRDGCEREAYRKGYCESHRMLDYGSCSIAGCDRGHSAKGLCHKHYTVQRNDILRTFHQRLEENVLGADVKDGDLQLALTRVWKRKVLK